MNNFKTDYNTRNDGVYDDDKYALNHNDYNNESYNDDTGEFVVKIIANTDTNTNTFYIQNATETVSSSKRNSNTYGTFQSQTTSDNTCFTGGSYLAYYHMFSLLGAAFWSRPNDYNRLFTGSTTGYDLRLYRSGSSYGNSLTTSNFEWIFTAI